MKIYWASIRKASDLCSTTTHALLEGLVRLGHEVVFLSPEPFQDTVTWTNITLQQSSVKGFHALSLATSARKWLEEVEAHANQCIIIDWPLAPRLGPLLKKRGHRLVLMDRSPPADDSVLGLLQWRHWKKAWRLVEQEVFSDGFVVSDMHLQFSSEYCKREKSIHILPAGVDTSLFSPKNRRINLDSPAFVYHGRLDKHRGVLALPMLIQRLRNIGKKATLTLIGEGNAMKQLNSIAREVEWLSVFPRMDRKRLAGILSEHDIGLLPMPESKVWKLASPLKRSEYLSSGLIVYGTDHPGHQISEGNRPYLKLVAQSNFHDECESWIESLRHENCDEINQMARAYAVEQLSWDFTVDLLEKILQKR